MDALDNGEIAEGLGGRGVESGFRYLLCRGTRIGPDVAWRVMLVVERGMNCRESAVLSSCQLADLEGESVPIVTTCFLNSFLFYFCSR